MAIAQDHQTAWKRTLQGQTGEVEIVLSEDEQHCTGIQIDVDGNTTGPVSVQYTPIQRTVTDANLKRTPQDNTFDNTNGIFLWPIKCWKIWVDLSGAGAGPFNIHIVGFKS